MPELHRALHTMVLFPVIGAVHINLTEDEIKYLEESYKAREAFGHN